MQVILMSLMEVALRRALASLPPEANGLLVRCFPVEGALTECVLAVQALLGTHEGPPLRVVIGSTQPFGGDLPRELDVLEPDQGAALVTQLRNPSGGPQSASKLIFICEVDCPGASGVSSDVFHELTTREAVASFAEARGLDILTHVSSAPSTWVRRTLEGVSLEEVAHFAEQAQREAESGDLQLAALPLLRLVPTKLSGQRSRRPTARWGKDWHTLTSGSKRATLQAAERSLKGLTGERRERATSELLERYLPEEALGGVQPCTFVERLAARAADLAAGDFEASAGLVGLTGDLLKKCLYQGEGAAEALARTDDEDAEDELVDDDVEGEDDSQDDDGPSELAEEEALEELERDDLRIKDDEVFLGTEYKLTESRDTSFISRLAEKAPASLWRDGGLIPIKEVEPFLGEHVSVEVLTPGVPALRPEGQDVQDTELHGLLTAFAQERARLLESLMAHLAERTEVDEGESDDSHDESGTLQAAVIFMEGHPLLLARQLPEECRRYVRSYLDLISFATRAPDFPGELFQWLANIDVALYKPPAGALRGAVDGVDRARLLPTHPLMIKRAQVHHELSGPPPELPSRLALRVPPRSLDLYPSSRGGFYAEVDQVRPDAEAVQRAALQGLEAAWVLLQRAGMTRSMGVHLQSLGEPKSVALALAERFRELLDEDEVADGVGHLELTWSSDVALPGVPLDSKEVLRQLPELASTPKGEGASISVGREPLNRSHAPAHLVVTETFADLDPAQQQAIYHPPGAEVWVKYEPAPSGVVTRITLDNSEAEELADEFACKLNGDGQRAAGLPRAPQESAEWLVRALASRGGWPEDPRETSGVLSYEVDERGNYVVVSTASDLLVGQLGASLEARYPFLFQLDSDLNLEHLRAGAFVMRSLSRVQLDLLSAGSAESTKVRGDLGQLRALLMLRQELSAESLVLDLDCSEGLALARSFKRSFGTRQRADLLTLEHPEEGELKLRVIELKTYRRCPGQEGRAKLAKQALITRSRLEVIMPDGRQEPARSQIEALRRLCWLGASNQRAAWTHRPLLESLDQALASQAGSPRVTVTAECWIIPEEASAEPERFEQEVQDLDAEGRELQSLRAVTFRVLPPLPIVQVETGAPAPRGSTSDEPLQPPQPTVDDPSGAAEPRPQAPCGVPTDQPADPSVPTVASEQPPSERRESSGATADAQQDAASTRGPLELTLGADLDATPLRVQPGSLENRNIMVSGSSGMGKTQVIKSLILQLRQQGYPVIALDFKNDFASDLEFCRKAELEPAYVLHDGLPFNPLIPPVQVHPGTGEASISLAAHVQGLAGTLKATYRLGDQQENKLKKSIRKAYENHGIRPTGSVSLSEDQVFPTFQEVGEELCELDELAYSRLDPLFDLELFRAQAAGVGFGQLLSKATVLDLSALPSDQAKAALAKFFLIAAHSHYNPLPQAGDARQFFVFDEAHRVMDEPKFLQFIRECRAYGVGTVVSSQNPTDFSKEVSASLALRVIHGNGPDAERVKGIARLVGLEGQERRIRSLTKFKAIAQFAGGKATFINTLHYPALLVLDALQTAQGLLSEQDLESTPGLDPSKTSVQDLLRQLQDMGLAVAEDGSWRTS